MGTTLLTDPHTAEAFVNHARPEPLAGGIEPEERIVVCGIGWEGYLAFDKALGADRPGPRFYYLAGDLEIMSTSEHHEKIKKLVADLLAVFFEHTDIEIFPRGQATMRVLQEAGAEPDESWCLGENKQWPDLVLEIALTSGGLPKLELYRRFAVPEVWIWRSNALEIHVLRADNTAYERAAASRVLPTLPVELLERCVGIASWREARRAFRSGLV